MYVWTGNARNLCLVAYNGIEKIDFFVHWSLNLDGHNQPTDIWERKERDGTKSPVTGSILLRWPENPDNSIGDFISISKFLVGCYRMLLTGSQRQLSTAE